MYKSLSAVLIFLTIFTSYSIAKSKGENQGGKYTVVPVLQLGNPSSQAVTYSLPRTELEIIVVAEKTHYVRGPFYQYSERYLGLKDVIIENEVQWDMIDVSVNPVGTPDPDNQFAIQFTGDVGAPFIANDANGCISSINYFFDGTTKKTIKEAKTSSVDESFDFVPYTEEMLVANSTAKKAEEAAVYISRIRENRTLLLSGESSNVHADGTSLQLALDELEKQEKQFLELFRGKVIHKVEKRHIHYLPQQEVERELLFRFSKFKGMVAKDNFSGEPVFLNIAIQDSVNISDEPLQPELDEKGREISSVPNAGLYYRIPGSASVSLSYSGKTFYAERLFIAQFGKIFSLPESILQKPNQSVIFNTETGAIKAILNNN